MNRLGQGLSKNQISVVFRCTYSDTNTIKGARPLLSVCYVCPLSKRVNKEYEKNYDRRIHTTDVTWEEWLVGSHILGLPVSIFGIQRMKRDGERRRRVSCGCFTVSGRRLIHVAMLG